jgi:hypothetical protein
LTIDSFLAGRASVSDLETFDSLHANGAVAETVIFGATIVAWLAWQWRTIDNEARLRIGPSPWSPAMSIVWWFVPFANLVQPYRIHRDMYVRYVGPRAGVVLLWWLAYIGSSLMLNFAGRVWLALETLDGLQSGLILWFVADLASALAVFPAVALVSRIQRPSEELGSTIERSPVSTPGPSVATT